MKSIFLKHLFILLFAQRFLSNLRVVDILRRVSIVIHQHIQKCELRQAMATPENMDSGTFRQSQAKKFYEEHFMVPEYVYHFVRAPVARLGFLYGIRKQTNVPAPPTLTDIHTFIRDLFMKGMLSAECSIGRKSTISPSY